MKKGSQVKDGMAVVSTIMEKSLANALDELANERGKRHAVLEKLLLLWLKSWSTGVMPGLYVGARSKSSIQRSYYISEQTAAKLQQVAAADGVAVSHVVRTAFAWAVAGAKKPRDVWGTLEMFGPRAELE